MRKLYTLVFLILYAAVSYSQGMKEVWARSAGGAGADGGFAVDVDHRGGVYVAGTFRGAAAFGSFHLSSANSSSDIFLAKYDTSGTVLWVTRFGGVAHEGVTNLVRSSDGSLYVTGQESQTTGDPDHTSQGFLVKFNATGSIQWTKVLGQGIPDVVTDAFGFVYAGVGGFTKYAPDGSEIFTRTFPNYNGPLTLLATNAAGNIIGAYYSATQYQRLAEYQPDGSLVKDTILGSGQLRWYARGLKKGYYTGEFVNLTGGSNLFLGFPGSLNLVQGSSQFLKKPVNPDSDGSGNAFFAGTLEGIAVPPSFLLRLGSTEITSSTGRDIYYIHNLDRLYTTKNNGNTNEHPGKIAVDTVGRALYIAGTWSRLSDTSKFRFGNAELTNAGSSDFLLLKLAYTPVAPLPFSFNAGPHRSVCEGGSVSIGAPATGGTGNYSYQWTPSTGLDNPLSPTPIAKPAANTVYIVTATDGSGVTLRDTVSVIIDSTLYRPTISIIHGSVPFCEGSMITLGSSSGSSYQWTNVSSNQQAFQNVAITAPGIYSVRNVAANGCVGTSLPFAVTTIPQPPAPVIITNGPGVICGNGFLTLRVQTGITPQAYEWNNGALSSSLNVIHPGQYSVRVKDSNGCWSPNASITITAADVPAANIAAGGPTTFCEGDSVRLTVTTSGGNSIVWSNGATTNSIWAKQAGTYSAQVTSPQGCPVTTNQVQVVLKPKPPAPVIQPNSSTTFCGGDSVKLTALVPPNFFGLQWSTGETTVAITVKASGTYRVRQFNNQGCFSDEGSVLVTVAAHPAAAINQQANVLNVQPAAATYQWYLDAKKINGATGQQLTITEGGRYTVAVTNSGGCTTTATHHAVYRVNHNGFSYQVYPNPADDYLSVVYTLDKPEKVSITIRNHTGQIAHKIAGGSFQTAGEHHYTISNVATRLQPGIYYIEFTIGNRITVQKIFIR
jgi:hypothetical protein